MELVSQHVKGIMEECKIRARDAGLRFDDETLEYIVTNRDLIELSPKVMIPTLYDYWVHDVKVLSGKGMYEAYPSNPFETVINTRPAISYYNDNNPDWLNVMIFYHVLAHIDFFQNNLFYKNTWDIDIAGQALADKRLIAQLRSEKGRWLDYVIEFARGMDNLVGFHRDLNRTLSQGRRHKFNRTDFYFDLFLQKIKSVPQHIYLKEISRYNQCAKDKQDFFIQVTGQYPEFDELFRKEKNQAAQPERDIMEYILRYSPFLRKEENEWMKSVIHIIRNTSLFFQPQIRTKTMNEGWASYWHENLFLKDDRICGHEADYAKINASVTAMPKVGLNPYALGMRLFEHIREMEDKGCYSFDYVRLNDEVLRKKFDRKKNTGRKFIFTVRENMDDFSFINTFLDQEFIDRHKLFVAGKRLNNQRMTWQYYIKSKKAHDYKKMIINSLYHPPDISIAEDKTKDGILYLDHRFENKPLKQAFIENTLIGIAFLWGGPVHLETSEPKTVAQPGAGYANFWDPSASGTSPEPEEIPIQWQRVRYVIKDRKLHRQEL
ncbi:MAG: SpoVR family protein [Desulfotignum sp.]|nr:SpoVR family protein [Desulfotignum sp.]MCF8112348.1 SpoVR family protein [Desulfotignum sp.]MCF8124614.1 SpoVR family protein [Desulfotignum sp.]